MTSAYENLRNATPSAAALEHDGALLGLFVDFDFLIRHGLAFEERARLGLQDGNKVNRVDVGFVLTPFLLR